MNLVSLKGKVFNVNDISSMRYVESVCEIHFYSNIGLKVSCSEKEYETFLSELQHKGIIKVLVK